MQDTQTVEPNGVATNVCTEPSLRLLDVFVLEPLRTVEGRLFVLRVFVLYMLQNATFSDFQLFDFPAAEPLSR